MQCIPIDTCYSEVQIMIEDAVMIPKKDVITISAKEKLS